MHKLSPLAIALVIAALCLGATPYTGASTITSTVIGWNVPNMTTLGNGLIAMILPLGVAAFFVGFALFLKVKGNITVTLALVGFTGGSLLGMLSTNGNGFVSPLSIPFAQVIIGAVLLITWLWKGGQ